MLLTAPVPRGAFPALLRRGAEALRLENGLLLPVAASLSPPLLPDEVARLFPLPVELFHPRFGRVSFECAEGQLVHDLVAGRPPSGEVRWDRAVAGAALPKTIGPVRAKISPRDLDAFGAEFREDIGAGSLDDMPSEAFETQGGSVSPLKRWLAERAKKYADNAPRTAREETWVNRLGDWAEGVLGTRDRERSLSAVDWLLKTLESDPERGLRHAMPLGGDSDGSRRGRVEELKLHEHDADFSLDRLGIQRGAVGFDLPAHKHVALNAAYRGAAMDAMARGEYRKAAFIYAHLLDDLRGAAGLLANGGHHREAAALWMERLNDPEEAAKCLESGGWVDEAVSIYAERQRYEEAAEVLSRAGRTTEALGFWEQAVAVARHGRPIHGATMAEERLVDPDLAAEILLDQWKSAKDGPARVGRWLELQGRQGEYGSIQRWLRSDAGEELAGEDRELSGSAKQEALWRAVSGAAHRIHDPKTLAQLDDTARVAIARIIVRGEGKLRRAALEAFGAFPSDDRVLRRDLSFIRRAAPRSPAPDVRPRRSIFARGAAKTPVEEERFDLPFSLERSSLFELRPCGDGLLVARYDGARRRVEVRLVGWSGQDEGGVHWDGVDEVPTRLLFPSTGPKGSPVSTLVALGGDGQVIRRLERQSFAASSGVQWTFGTPSFVPDRLFDLHVSKDGHWVAAPSSSDQVQLQRMDETGRSSDVGVSVSITAPHGAHLARVGSRTVLIADSSAVFSASEPSTALPIELPGPILYVRTSPERTSGRTVLVTGNGVVLLRDTGRGDQVQGGWKVETQTLTQGDLPHAAFLRDGSIAVVTFDTHTLYRTHQAQVHVMARREVGRTERPAVAVTAGKDAGSYAVLDDRGRVTIYRVS